MSSVFQKPFTRRKKSSTTKPPCEADDTTSLSSEDLSIVSSSTDLLEELEISEIDRSAFEARVQSRGQTLKDAAIDLYSAIKGHEPYIDDSSSEDDLSSSDDEEESIDTGESEAESETGEQEEESESSESEEESTQDSKASINLSETDECEKLPPEKSETKINSFESDVSIDKDDSEEVSKLGKDKEAVDTSKDEEEISLSNEASINVSVADGNDKVTTVSSKPSAYSPVAVKSYKANPKSRNTSLNFSVTDKSDMTNPENRKTITNPSVTDETTMISPEHDKVTLLDSTESSISPSRFITWISRKFKLGRESQKQQTTRTPNAKGAQDPRDAPEDTSSRLEMNEAANVQNKHKGAQEMSGIARTINGEGITSSGSVLEHQLNIQEKRALWRIANDEKQYLLDSSNGCSKAPDETFCHIESNEFVNDCFHLEDKNTEEGLVKVVTSDIVDKNFELGASSGSSKQNRFLSTADSGYDSHSSRHGSSNSEVFDTFDICDTELLARKLSCPGTIPESNV